MYIRKINNDSWRDGIYYYKDPEFTILHREDGPAVEYTNGTKVWCLNGKFHREDGPAIIYADGNKSYYLNNNWLTKEEYIEYIKAKTLCPVKKSRILKNVHKKNR